MFVSDATLWFLIFCVGVTFLIFLTLYFDTKSHLAPRNLSSKFVKETQIDVVLLEQPGFDSNLTITNFKQMLGPRFYRNVFTIHKETDLLGQLSSARLSRFFIFARTNMILSRPCSHEDFFGRNFMASFHSFALNKKANFAKTPFIVDKELMLECFPKFLKKNNNKKADEDEQEQKEKNLISFDYISQIIENNQVVEYKHRGFIHMKYLPFDDFLTSSQQKFILCENPEIHRLLAQKFLI